METPAQIEAEMRGEGLFHCPGCQRPELHKWCPAFGTKWYMSGIPLPEGEESNPADFRDDIDTGLEKT